jgi:RecA-family ATPase
MKAVTMLHAVCPTEWQGKPVPERRWLIPGMLIRGTVTMLNGDGGVGKSLLAQQLATAMATAQPFLGIQPHADPVRSLALFCEDSLEELQFRQSQINAHYRCDMADLAAMSIISRVGQDNGLMIFDRRTDVGEETPLYQQLAHRIRESGAELIIIDTAADTFLGNENIRPQVRQFIGALGRLAMINDGGVILNAHPSLTGLNSGSGLSGNTAWHNSVRGRLYLTRPPIPDGEEEQSDARILKLMKSNYGPSGEQTRLVWHDHVFVHEDMGRGTGGNLVDRIELDNTVLAGLRKQIDNGALVPADPNVRNGLPTRLRNQHSCQRWTFQTLAAAQERLTAMGRIIRVELGPPSKRRLYIRPHDMTLRGEVDIGNAGA